MEFKPDFLMDYKKYHIIKLDGKLIGGDELVQLCKRKIDDAALPLWEKSIYQFINEWLADADHIIVKTSGSTSAPKSIKLSKNVLIHSAKATEKFLNLKPNMNALLCLSVEYIAGKMMIVRAFVSSLNLLVVAPDGDPIKNLKAEIDFAAMIPLQVVNSLKTEIDELKNINNLIIGGGRIDPRLQQKLVNFPNKVYATYGMTETATHIALKKLNSTNPNEHYQCLPNIEIGQTSENCLVINAPFISKRKIETNDIVKIISNTEFAVLGRKDSIINTGGIKIMPEELETKISTFLQERILITSMEDEKLGEKIILLIENGKSNLNLLYTIWLQLENNLEKHEIPKQIDFMSSFKYTESGKIHRSLTKKSFLEQLK